MSNQYRKADCQSTKNVMGDKPVDPQSGPSGTKLGFEVQPEHAYLGHFKQEKFLREGHNFVRSTVMPAAAPGRRPLPGTSIIDRASRGLAKRAISAGGEVGAAVAAERPVLAARMAAKEAGVTGADRRALLKAARQDPNSAQAERRTRQAVRTGRRQGATQIVY